MKACITLATNAIHCNRSSTALPGMVTWKTNPGEASLVRPRVSSPGLTATANGLPPGLPACTHDHAEAWDNLSARCHGRHGGLLRRSRPQPRARGNLPGPPDQADPSLHGRLAQ